MRENPLKPLYELCNVGDSRHKMANLPDFPRMIDIELTNLCNFRCLMCPTGNRSMQRDQGFMADEVFYKVLEDIRGRNIALRFIRWGEPLMHPNLLPFLRAAKAQGVLLHLNTNGSHLTEEIAQALLDIQVDSIKFSFQGVDQQSYREMRNIDYFESLIEKVEMLNRLRGNSPVPFIQLSTTITYETPEMVEAFRQRLAPLADMLNVGRTSFDWLDLKAVRLKPAEVDMLMRLRDAESLVKVHPECPEVFDKLSINFDGKVTACCMDSDNLMVIGNVLEETVAQLWTNEKMTQYRIKLADMRHDEMELCRNCWDTHSLWSPAVKKDED
ncbi:MAG: radical SAM protein [Alphaproteobacteria bacterium]|nr:radical SAM protein [Alphaproteobacteria bacterium]